MSITKFIDYLQYEKAYSKHTVLAYSRDLLSFQEFIQTHFSESDLLGVSYKQIRRWIVFLAEKGLRNRSINRKLSALKSFYKFYEKAQLISLNPMAAHQSLKIKKEVMIPFSKKELDSLKELFIESDTFEQVRDLLIIELLYTTGIRRSELINLSINDVDLKNKNIKVLGKRNKERIIPVLDDTIVLMERYMLLKKNIKHDVSLLFITAKGKQIYASLVYKIIKKYFKTITTKEKKSPHVLRHTFATHLLDEGADLNVVKELLGHASLASTQIYTHASLRHLKDVYKKAHPRNSKKN